MISRINRVLDRYFGSNSYYSPVSESGAQDENVHIPGSFPGEEINSTNRRSINSRSIGQIFKRIRRWWNIVIIEPFVIILLVLFGVLAGFLKILYFRDSDNKRRSLSSASLAFKNVVINEPIDNVNNFTRSLESNLGPMEILNSSTSNTSGFRLPPFFLGSYSQALYMATNRARFLFVYLTNQQNEYSTLMLNKLIANPEFIKLFESDPNIIIWGGDTIKSEAYQLANTLNITQLPFLGILCLTRNTVMSPQGPVKSAPKISLVLKIQGDALQETSVEQIIEQKITKKLSKYEPELCEIREELRDKYMSQVLLKQQNMNYEISLKKDQLKKKKKMAERLHKEYLIWKAKELLGYESADITDKSKIAVKLENGTRKTFTIPAECSIEDLFAYVEAEMRGYLDRVNDFDISENDVLNKLQNTEINFNFKLVTPILPRIVLNEFLHKETPIKIKDVDCIYPNGLLIVENE